MKKILATLVLASASFLSQANTCVGSGAIQSCYDSQSGNSYTVSRFGNSTYVDGSNARTGSSWSSNSVTFGNTTYQTGRDKDGKSWNQTIQSFGNMTIRSGTDSDGNSFSNTQICTDYGCY